MASSRREFLRDALVAGAAVSGAGVLGPLLAGCSRSRRTQQRAKCRSLIMLGFDGLDPRLIRKWMSEGRLPNFAKLANQGGFSDLKSSLPAMSPIAWSSMSTGCNPGEHGIYDFVHRDPKTYLVLTSLRKAVGTVWGTSYRSSRCREGFWRYTSDEGVATSVIRYPITFPAEKVSGRMLSGLGVPDLLGTEGGEILFQAKGSEGATASGSVAETELRGPAVGPNKFLSLHVTLTRRGEGAVRVEIAGQPALDLKKHEWSPWAHVTFKVGLRRLRGIVRFLLLEAQPDLKLFVSAINLDPAAQAFPITYPSSYGTELAKQLGPFHTVGMPEGINPLRKGWFSYDDFLSQVAEIDRERLAMLDHELARFREGLLAFVFDASDRVQHALWFTRDPQHPSYDVKKATEYADEIPALYRKMDGALGKVLERADPQTVVMAVSDHGFTTFRRSVHINRWLVQNGFATLRDSGAGGGKGTIHDLDWSKTRAYAAGLSSIYINLAGREGHGIVRPGTEADRVRDEIIAKLESLVDPKDGGSVVKAAYKGAEVYHGAHVSEAPDIVIGMNEGWRVSIETALGEVPDRLFKDNTSAWTGDHIVDPGLVPGMLATNRKITAEAPQGMDVAPTVLDCLGIERPAHMDGKSFL